MQERRWLLDWAPTAHGRTETLGVVVGDLRHAAVPARPEAWAALLAEGNAGQARKRVGADVLIRDGLDRVLRWTRTYKPDWDLPGGMAEANEPPQLAAWRELREELGVDLPGSAGCCASTGSRRTARGTTR